MFNPNDTPTNESVAEQMQAAKGLSDEELMKKAAAAKAAREQAMAAEAQATAEVAPQITAAQKNIEDMFADMSDSTTRRIDAASERGVNRQG